MPSTILPPSRLSQEGRYVSRQPAQPHRLPPQLRLRRALTLLALSAVLPGSAQLAAGSRRVGRLALRVWLALVAGALMLGLLALVSRGTVLSLGVRPWALGLARVLLLGVAAGWALLLLDAWRLGRPGLLTGKHRLLSGGVAAALVAGLCGPLLVASSYAQAQRELVTSVFADGEAVATDGDRINVLLLGGDAGPSRVGTRPDSIILVSTDVATGRAVMFSLPRNLERARFAEGSPLRGEFPDGFDGMLNAVYTYGAEHPEAYPGVADAGAAATKDAVAGTLGLPVHYYALVDLRGFSSLVDALGGITLDVERRVPIGGGTSPVTGWIEPGVQRLDGYHALWYARSREGSTDYDRMARQRCVMGALMRQADPATVVRRFQAVARSAQRIVRTDVPQAALPDFVELALRAKDVPVTSVQFVPPLVDSTDPDVGAIHDKVAATLAAAEERDERPAQREPAATPAAEPAGAEPAADAGSPAVGSAAADQPDAEQPAAPAADRPDPAAGGEEVAVDAVCSYA